MASQKELFEEIVALNKSNCLDTIDKIFHGDGIIEEDMYDKNNGNLLYVVTSYIKSGDTITIKKKNKAMSSQSKDALKYWSKQRNKKSSWW